MEAINFSTLSTRKLNALLETADESECLEIREELARRGEAVILSEQPVILSEEELKVAAAIEQERRKREEESAAVDEDGPFSEALKREMRSNIDRRVRVVVMAKSFDCETMDGTITSVKKERYGYVYAISLDNGGHVSRVPQSQDLQMLNEFWHKKPFMRKKLSAEEAENLIEKNKDNVGRYARVRCNDSDHLCIIRSVRYEKTNNTVVYEFSDLDRKGRPMQRKIDSPYIELLDKYDTEVQSTAKVRTRKRVLTIEDRYNIAQKAFSEAEEAYLQAKETYEARKADLEDVKNQYLNLLG